MSLARGRIDHIGDGESHLISGHLTGQLNAGKHHLHGQADQQAQQQWEQEQAANYMQNRNNYNRAYGACLEGKGYTAK